MSSRTAVFLVAVVATVVYSITLPERWFALTVFTLQLRRVTLCRREEKCALSARAPCPDSLTPLRDGWRLGCQSVRALTAVVLIAVVSTVVPAVAAQRLVNAHVVVTLEASGTSCPIRQEDILRTTAPLEECRLG